MRVLVTGSTGFIGQRLGIALVRAGHEVVALVRRPVTLPFPAEVQLWDQADLRDIDAIIHLAGESVGEGRWTSARKKQILESRTGTLSRLAELVAKGRGRKPEVLLSASGVGLYGNRGDEEVDATSAPGEGFLAEVCRAWEVAAENFPVARKAFLRTGLVLGRGGGALDKIFPIFKWGLGGRLGSGRQWMSWIHVDDLVRLYLFALEKENVRGPLLAVAPHPVRNADFTRALAHALRAPAFLPAPSLALRLFLGEQSGLLLDGQRVRENVSELGFPFAHENLAEALLSLTKEVERARGLRCQEITSRAWLDCPVEEAFGFLAVAKNIERILPPHYQCQILSAPPRLGEGTFFDFRWLFRGLPLYGRHHAFDWVENQRFQLTQQKGVFLFWAHQHQFERLGGGTLLTERVLFRLRFGYWGDWFGQKRILRELGEIFAHRRARLSDLLGRKRVAASAG